MPSPLKQNEPVLSSQTLNVGMSLGINSNMEKFIFDSDVRGYRVCKDVWNPAIGKILHAEQELDNTVQKQRNSRLCTVRVLANFVFNCTWWKEL